MAESDFTVFGAVAATIKCGVSARFTPPNGGGQFVFGFNAQVAAAAAVGLYYTATNFSPLRDDLANATGGSVQAAIMRGVSPPASSGFCVGIFINQQGYDITDHGYILGLSDDDPAKIVLVKGAFNAGFSSTDATVLASSTDTVPLDEWAHLRLDSIVNPNGDVVLKAFRSNLTSHPVTAPSWEEISGISDFIDDALGVGSGSNPFAGGYVGFGFYSEIIQGHGFVDSFKASRQQ